jgi:hypothetical protein
MQKLNKIGADETSGTHNLEDICPERSHDLDRCSFLRTTGLIAAASMTGGLSFPAIARASGGASTRPLVTGRRKLGNAALLRTPVYGARLRAGVLSLSGVEAPRKQS